MIEPAIPEKEDQTAASRFYAENYERLYHKHLADSTVTDAIADVLKPIVATGDNILIVDLGCGIGDQLTCLSKALSLPLHHNIGVDISPAMHARHDTIAQSSTSDCWTFIEGDFTAEVTKNTILNHIAQSGVKHVVFLCLGNAIGHIEPDKYTSLASLIHSASESFCGAPLVHLFIEYRDGHQYRELHRPNAPVAASGRLGPNAYGSAEFLGQTSDFYAFYIREDIDENKYKVSLYALSMKPLTKESLNCGVSVVLIDNAFYVDDKKLFAALESHGMLRLPWETVSALETGKLVGLTSDASKILP